MPKRDRYTFQIELHLEHAITIRAQNKREGESDADLETRKEQLLDIINDKLKKIHGKYTNQTGIE